LDIEWENSVVYFGNVADRKVCPAQQEDDGAHTIAENPTRIERVWVENGWSLYTGKYRE
jgi:hypothetical protein